MWGKKQREERREIEALRARVAKLLEERDEARQERTDARANRKRIQDLYDDLASERDSKAKPPEPATPDAPTPETAGRGEPLEDLSAFDKLRTAEPLPAGAEVRRQLHVALSRVDALARRVSELQDANLRYAREAFDRAEAARRAEVPDGA